MVLGEQRKKSTGQSIQNSALVPPGRGFHTSWEALRERTGGSHRKWKFARWLWLKELGEVSTGRPARMLSSADHHGPGLWNDLGKGRFEKWIQRTWEQTWHRGNREYTDLGNWEGGGNKQKPELEWKSYFGNMPVSWKLSLYSNLFRGLKAEVSWDFPGGLVVRASCFHCGSMGSIPGWELRSHMQPKTNK